MKKFVRLSQPFPDARMKSYYSAVLQFLSFALHKYEAETRSDFIPNVLGPVADIVIVKKTMPMTKGVVVELNDGIYKSWGES